MFFAGIGKHFEHVLAVGRVHHVVIGIFCVPHTKSVVMLRRKADILHPSLFCKENPLFGIVVYGIKGLPQSLIFFSFPIEARVDLLLHSRLRVDAPMDEHTEFVIKNHFPAIGSENSA